MKEEAVAAEDTDSVPFSSYFLAPTVVEEELSKTRAEILKHGSMVSLTPEESMGSQLQPSG